MVRLEFEEPRDCFDCVCFGENSCNALHKHLTELTYDSAVRDERDRMVWKALECPLRVVGCKE